MKTGLRPAWRRLALGLATLLGGRPRGFFIPYRYAGGVRAPAHYPAAEDLFAAARGDFAAVLDEVAALGSDLGRIDESDRPPAPRWGQDWFAPLDAAVLYSMVRRYRPGRLVEIGSGHSTRFAARAIADGAIANNHLAIDPAPRADIAALNLTLQRRVLGGVDMVTFGHLAAGDILFIDSSHILMPGTDVDQLLNGVLPALKPGVVVHIHDITLPDGYPAAWAWRGYNEQLAVLPLLSGGAYRPLFASHYAATRMSAEAAGVLPPAARRAAAIRANPATSLWLEKR
jgi:predicted O-methyltransferase YrrM